VERVSLFPDIYPSVEYFWAPRAQQNVLDLANGSRQVNETSPFLQREFTLRYGAEDDAEFWGLIFPHFEANRGGIFSFYDFWLIPHATPVRFAIGDGATRTFTLPAKEAEDVVIRVNNAPRSAMLLGDAGVEGETLVTFSVADTPALGSVLTWTAARARRKFRVSYYGGPNTPATIKPIPVEGGLWGTELQLIEEIVAYV
jgi:hypothetical protein